MDSQVDTVEQLQIIINQFTANRVAFKNRLNIIGIAKVKMLAVKRFSGKKAKFKEFLT